VTRASIFHIPTLAGTGSNNQLGAANATEEEATEDVSLAPFATIESSQVARREPLSSEAFPRLRAFPEACLSARFRIALLPSLIPDEHSTIAFIAEHLEDR
jgi:hypothetical protein